MKSKILFSCILALGFASSAQAAKFSTLKKLKNPALAKLSAFAKTFVDNEDTYGDCTSVGTYSITRKTTETNVNTLEQLNVAKAGLWHDEDPKTALVKEDATEQEIVVALFDTLLRDSENEASVKPTMTQTEKLLEKVRKDARLEVYETNHANEDGSWAILNVLDTQNEEVLLIRIGFCGT